ncbi:hypothetical protein OG21DRAFT_933784 [Imleria badia]|nr:hypothetical protein OG21DRAFT_933784 [Imleria badia]
MSMMAFSYLLLTCRSVRIIPLTSPFCRFPNNTTWYSCHSIWLIDCQIRSSDHWMSGIVAVGPPLFKLPTSTISNEGL